MKLESIRRPARLKKFARLKGLRLRFKMPSSGSIFVLGGHANHPVDVALADLPVFDYSLHEVQIWIRARYLIALFRWTFSYGFSAGRLLAIIQVTSGHAVITLEADDRRNLLYAVSCAIPSVRIIAIQHSARYEAPHLFNPWANGSNVRLFVWGQDLCKVAERLGLSRRLMMVVGSIRLAQYLTNPPQITGKIEILVCVKQKALRYTASLREMREMDQRIAQSKRALLAFIGRYAHERDLWLCFPRDPRENKSEAASALEIFSELTGAKCRYVLPADYEVTTNGGSPQATYSLLRAARVVVGVNTSLLYDAVVLKSPVVHASFGSHNYSKFPIEAPWVLNNPAYEDFECQIEAARGVSADELARRSREFSQFLENPDYLNASDVLRETVKRSLLASDLDEVVDGYDDLLEFSKGRGLSP